VEKVIRLGITFHRVEEVMKSPIVLLESLLHDCKRLNPAVEGLDRDLQTIKKRFEHEGYGFLTVSLPALDEALLLGLSNGRFACPTGFKPIRGGAIPRFLSGMLCEVFEPFTGTLKENADLSVMKCIRNVLRLFKKMQLTSESEDLLHKKAVAGFYLDDDTAGQVSIPDRHDHLLGRVTKVLLNTLNSKDVKNATFRHGPGAVEEGQKANQKWKALSDELRSGSFDAIEYGLDVQTHHYRDCTDGPSRVSNGNNQRKTGTRVPARRGSGEDGRHTTTSNGVSLFNRASGRRARLVTVAKSSTARRTITVEPMLNQFVQQGLNILLREAISECRILRNCLALSDQSKNQELALSGSRTDDWATIDLKSASDLLSVKLVESVFRHHGLFFDHMMDCRSTGVYCDLAETKHLRKFAGMGNALTFPVQSISFAAVCLAAIIDSQGRNPTYWNLRRASRCIRIYGDDIIVKREYAQQCVNWLQTVGLKVNTKKSFLKGNFKESCGVDAFRGVDITPLYIKHRPDDGATDPNIIAGLVSLANTMWMQCLYSASTCLREEVEERLRKTLPLVSSRSGLLGWHSRKDSSHAHKWCKRTQQLVVRGAVLLPLKRADRLNGYAALLKYFCRSDRSGEGPPVLATWSDYIFPPKGEDVDHLESTPIRFKSRISQRWVPARVTGQDSLVV
jgi:hypothetical protein